MCTRTISKNQVFLFNYNARRQHYTYCIEKLSFSVIVQSTPFIEHSDEVEMSTGTFSIGPSFRTIKGREFAWVSLSKANALGSAIGLDTTLEIGST